MENNDEMCNARIFSLSTFLDEQNCQFKIISYYPADVLKKDKDVDCKDNLVQLSAPH